MAEKHISELLIGRKAYCTKTITESDVYLFAGITGDFNRIHVDEEYAKTTPSAFLDMPDNFDFYRGGGLDLTVLSFAQVDKHGNVNVSKFGGRINGCGGFVDISQSAKKGIFVSTFSAGGLNMQVNNDSIQILQEGKHRKFIENVEQITFSGKIAAQRKQDVQYITERAVFRLVEEELELTEIAPGIDLQKDILANMDFNPKLSNNLSLMPARIFKKNIASQIDQ